MVIFVEGEIVGKFAAQWPQCFGTAVAPVCPLTHQIAYLSFAFFIWNVMFPIRFGICSISGTVYSVGQL